MAEIIELRVPKNWPALTGDWATDCQAGRDHAEAVLDLIGEPADYVKATRLIGEAVQRGRMSGVEVGFFQRLIELAVTGRQ